MDVNDMIAFQVLKLAAKAQDFHDFLCNLETRKKTLLHYEMQSFLWIMVYP